jgi:hypothetical protein
MFFFAFFWGFIHTSLSPAYSIGGVWTTKAIVVIYTYTVPLTNKFILKLLRINYLAQDYPTNKY